MKKAALYARTSTVDQHPESQLIQLREIAAQRGFEVVATYCDHGISGSKARRPGIDAMMRDGRRGRFSVILTAAFDRLARSTKNFIAIIDEAESANIQIISAREAVDTSTPTGRMFVTMLGCIAEMEKSFIVERVRAGIRRRRLEGLRVGRRPLDLDHASLIEDRMKGMSLTAVAKRYGVSRASVVRWVREAQKMTAIHGLNEEVAA
ncbi:recombinase family protein [Occallatibacter savannae]|uniref:recombinase family protein n=1 Tax=Occallatibacter savannae TaxID=1002691 RepID=UPI000D69BCAA|nr:recombinase family protein [Occallatibacter savannae]